MRAIFIMRPEGIEFGVAAKAPFSRFGRSLDFAPPSGGPLASTRSIPLSKSDQFSQIGELVRCAQRESNPRPSP